MKTIRVILQIFVLYLVLINTGCDSATTDVKQPVKDNKGINTLSVHSQYDPLKIDIMPLTEFVGVSAEEYSQITVYVSLLDAFGCQMKTPSVFRFELYEYVARTVDRKGKRLYLWPDIDLNDATENNNYWKDFLRAYNFTLNTGIDPGLPRTYVLQVTCVMPTGKRLTDIFYLNVKKN